MAELKPCPFCDGEAEMRNPWTSNTNYYVECYECGCTTAIFDTPEKAVEAWNRRADSPHCGADMRERGGRRIGMRPIDADELMRKYCGTCNIADDTFCLNCKYHEFMASVKVAPTIELEVQHGRWINDTFCSECKRFPVPVSVSIGISGKELTKYFSRCPHCGAKMNGGTENGNG